MGSITPEALFPRRLAARALAMVLERFNLLGVTVKFNADDPSQVLPGAAHGELWFYDDFRGGAGRILVHVFLEGTRARVVVPSLAHLIRSNHRRDFRPEEVGIFPRRGAPDIDATVDLAEVIDTDGEMMRTARQNLYGPRPRRSRGTLRIIRADGSVG